MDANTGSVPSDQPNQNALEAWILGNARKLRTSFFMIQKSLSLLLMKKAKATLPCGAKAPILAPPAEATALDTSSSDAPKVQKQNEKKPNYDINKAELRFDEECPLCHETSDVDNAPPRNQNKVNQMLLQMIDNGLDIDKKNLALICFYLIETYIQK